MFKLTIFFLKFVNSLILFNGFKINLLLKTRSDVIVLLLLFSLFLIEFKLEVDEFVDLLIEFKLLLLEVELTPIGEIKTSLSAKVKEKKLEFFWLIATRYEKKTLKLTS